MNGTRGHMGRVAVPVVAGIVLLAGCSGGSSRHAVEPRRQAPRALAVHVFADTGNSQRLAVRPPAPAARVWLARVTRATSAAASLPPPEAPPDTMLPEPSPPALVVDDALKPPIERFAAPLRIPSDRADRSRSVELDVRVDRLGRVAAVRWAGGEADTALVRAAVECAQAMSFYPALLRGEPVDVWCRQRFDFDR